MNVFPNFISPLVSYFNEVSIVIVLYNALSDHINNKIQIDILITFLIFSVFFIIIINKHIPIVLW